MSSKHKGGGFERDICRELSEWWSNGAHDDLFWRTSGSGSRATVRGDKRTTGNHGDVMSTHPSSAPLIDLMVIEIKKGYSKETVGEIFDKATDGPREMEAWIVKAEASSEAAGTAGWMLIHRRDRRRTVCWLPLALWEDLTGLDANPGVWPFVRFDLKIGKGQPRALAGILFDDFKRIVRPEHIRDLNRRS